MSMGHTTQAIQTRATCGVALSWMVVTSVGFAYASPKPHIVFFMVDDWGYNDVGYHRTRNDPTSDPREINTPNIDGLVAQGVELDRHYAYQWCTPTRSSFLSGRLPVHINALNGNACNEFEGIPRNMTGIAAKLKIAGYKTYQLGKWDAGMATPDHTPKGRGFDTSLGYFDHENDYFTYRPQTPFNTSFSKGPCPVNANIRDFWDTDKPAAALANLGIYEEQILYERATEIITTHPKSSPMFLYYAFHIVHGPLEVPQDWLNKYNFIKDSITRQTYHAMVEYMDTVVGNVTGLLRSEGLYDNTLIVCSSDNGGPVYPGGGANNYPLRGGKISDWEGGIRVNAFVSGGFLPVHAVGTKVDTFVHIADWYATFCGLAGVDPEDNVPGLPGVDSKDIWPVVTGMNASSPRRSILISKDTLIATSGELMGLKLITGMGPNKIGVVAGPTSQNGWQGPVYPNGTSPDGRGGMTSLPRNCTAGCLFDILNDPTEHVDIAEARPEALSVLLADFKMQNATQYIAPVVPNSHKCCTQAIANGGFLGPYLA